MTGHRDRTSACPPRRGRRRPFHTAPAAVQSRPCRRRRPRRRQPEARVTPAHLADDGARLIWAAGVLAVVGRLVVGLIAVQWMSRRTVRVVDAPWLPLAVELAAELGITRRLTFLESARATMPMAAGIFAPSVLMPEDANRWPLERLRIVLLHELAHVKRRDCLTHVIAQLACALHWFNPLAWIAARHIRTERERACDDLVLACGTRGSGLRGGAARDCARHARRPLSRAAGRRDAGDGSSLAARRPADRDPRSESAALGRVAAPDRRSRPRRSPARCHRSRRCSRGPWRRPKHAASSQRRRDLAPARADPRRHSRASAPSPHRSHVLSRATAADRQRPSRRRLHRPSATPWATALRRRMQRGASSERRRAGRGSGRHAGRQSQIAWQDVVAGVVQGAVQGALHEAGTARSHHARRQARRRIPRMVAALTAALKDSDKEVRETAMHALVQLRDPSIFEPLVQALKDPSPDVREQAAHGLCAAARQARRRAADRRAEGFECRRARERRARAQPAPRSPRRRCADRPRSRTTIRACASRRRLRSANCATRAPSMPLIAALKDVNGDVREQAVFALGQLRDKRAAGALAGLIKDTDADVREQVVFALGQLRDVAAIDGLIGALRDAKPDVRQQAAFALRADSRRARGASPSSPRSRMKTPRCASRQRSRSARSATAARSKRS